MKRIGVYLFYDSRGRVDPYIAYALRAFKEHLDHLLVICNGDPDSAGLRLLQECADEVVVRENIGYDVGAYKHALNFIGRDRLALFDELLLMNYTFFGPIFPLDELFTSMSKRQCDFWGITAHKACPSPFGGDEILPLHIQSHFIAVRGEMLRAQEFWDYWDEMPHINSYAASIGLHEARFTKHFSDLGYQFAIYMDPEDFDSNHPIFVEVDDMIQRRCPILKRRPFFHDPLYLEMEAIDLRRAVDLVEKNTDYPVELIWSSVSQAAAPRDIYTNAEMLSVFPHSRLKATTAKWEKWRIAIVVHLYYPEMADEIAALLDNLPRSVDLYVTTDTEEKSRSIGSRLKEHGNLDLLDIRVVFSNLGRDTSALLIGCRDVVLDGGYDLICRLHGKRSPQDGHRGVEFKRHLFGNLVGSPGYVANIFDLFESNRAIGIVTPPVVQIGFPTLGHAWFTNKPVTKRLADELGLECIFDANTPLAPLGSMFWFRPEALRPLFKHNWSWEKFREDSYGDGDLPHAIERIIPYCAQSQSFVTWCASTPESIARNYVKVEYKYQLLSSCFQLGDARGQVATMLELAQRLSGAEMDLLSISGAIGVKQSLRQLASSLKASAKYRIKMITLNAGWRR